MMVYSLNGKVVYQSQANGQIGAAYSYENGQLFQSKAVNESNESGQSSERSDEGLCRVLAFLS